MSKASEKALESAINQGVALRRRITDCRFPLAVESELLQITSDVIALLELRQTPVTKESVESVEPADDN